jgi:regulatory protein
MMEHTITALNTQKRNPNRVNVYLDGEFAFGLARITAAWLQVGQKISDEKIIELQAQDGYEQAYQRSLRFLNYRPRTRMEIEKNLREHGVSDETIASVLERLVQLGLVDDAGFAQQWVENRIEFRPRGRRLLTYELRQHGVDEESIEAALSELDDEALANEAARRFAPRLANLDELGFRQKMIRRLAQRGFGYEACRSAADKAWADLQAEKAHLQNTKEEIK